MVVKVSKLPIPFSSLEAVLRESNASLITLPELVGWLRRPEEFKMLKDQSIWVSRDSSIPSANGFYRIDRTDSGESTEVKITLAAKKAYEPAFNELPLEQRLIVSAGAVESKEFALAAEPHYHAKDFGYNEGYLWLHAIEIRTILKARFAFIDRPGIDQDKMLEILDREVKLVEKRNSEELSKILEARRELEAEKDRRRQQKEKEKEDQRTAAISFAMGVASDRTAEDKERRDIANEEREKRERYSSYNP